MPTIWPEMGPSCRGTSTWQLQKPCDPFVESLFDDDLLDFGAHLFIRSNPTVWSHESDTYLVMFHVSFVFCFLFIYFFFSFSHDFWFSTSLSLMIEIMKYLYFSKIRSNIFTQIFFFEKIYTKCFGSLVCNQWFDRTKMIICI